MPRIWLKCAASPFIVLLLVGGFAAIFGDSLAALLRYERGSVEVWRLLTAHFVHLGWSHFLLNAAGLAFVGVLFHDRLSTPQWWFVVASSVVLIDAGFWILNPELQRYVGLSGVLHGMLAAGLLAGTSTRRLESLLIGVILVAKLAYEQRYGALPGSASTTGGAVIVDAHLYGAIGGALAAAVLVGLRRRASV